MSQVNPYASPEFAAEPDGGDVYTPKMFSVQGRIGRLRYFCYSVVLNFILMFVLGVLMAMLIPMQNLDPENIQSYWLLLALIYIPILAVFIILAKRRLNDLNHSGWLVLLQFVPLVNILFALYMMLWPGTKGRNNYGPAPEPNSTAIIIGGVVAPLVVIGILAAVAIPAYQDYVTRAQQFAPQATD